MRFRTVTLCKPCLNKNWPLRKQLLWSFLFLAAVSLIIALAVVMVTTAIISERAESEAEKSLQNQIERHLKAASVEAAATIGEKFRRLQYGVLDVTAFALRDAVQEDLILDGGGEGYPLTPAHTDLRDTEIADSPLASLEDFYRQNVPVDLSRSVWYYADGTPTATVEPEDEAAIAKSARLDLLLPTMYANSNDTKAVVVGIPELPQSNLPLFRYFPGTDLSSVEGSAFSCEPEGEGESGCYDPRERDWYTNAADADRSDETYLGDVVVTDPYIDAIGSEVDWLVTLSRAVYYDSGTSVGQLLGVVGVDVRLEQVQESIEGIHFLDTGYSILATEGDGTVLASRVWDRNAAEETETVCGLELGICVDNDGEGWNSVISVTRRGVYAFAATSSDGGSPEESILVAAPVNTTFDTETDVGTTTHYILSAVPRDEIFEPVDGMLSRIRSSATYILATTGFVAAATLVAVAFAVYVLAGSITRPIVKMTSAARSIEKDGAKTDVFGGVAAAWGGGGGRSDAGGSSVDSTALSGASRGTRAIDYLLCRGEDEINTLAREFSLMITGLGKRGSAARATGLEDSSVYPKNPFTTNVDRASHGVPSAPPAR